MFLLLVFGLFSVSGCSVGGNGTVKKTLDTSASLLSCQGYMDPGGNCVMDLSQGCPEGLLLSESGLSCEENPELACPQSYEKVATYCAIKAVNGQCADGHILNGEYCILESTACPKNQKYDVTKKACIDGTPSSPALLTMASCLDGQLGEQGCQVSFQCSDDLLAADGQCWGIPACPPGGVFQNKACYGQEGILCPEGSYFSQGRCVGLPICQHPDAQAALDGCLVSPKCPQGSTAYERGCMGEVTCPPEAFLDNGRCLLKGEYVSCPSSSFKEGNQCFARAQCPSGTLMTSKGCLSVPEGILALDMVAAAKGSSIWLPKEPLCSGGKAYQGRCVLDPKDCLSSGSYAVEGGCALLPTCASGEIFNQEKEMCMGLCEESACTVCSDGSSPDVQGRCPSDKTPFCPEGSQWDETENFCRIYDKSQVECLAQSQFFQGFCLADQGSCSQYTFHGQEIGELDENHQCVLKPDFASCPCVDYEGRFVGCDDPGAIFLQKTVSEGVLSCVLPAERLVCPPGTTQNGSSCVAPLACQNPDYEVDEKLQVCLYKKSKEICPENSAIRRMQDGKDVCMRTLSLTDCPDPNSMVLSSDKTMCILKDSFLSCPGDMILNNGQCVSDDYSCPGDAYVKDDYGCRFKNQMVLCPKGTKNISEVLGEVQCLGGDETKVCPQGAILKDGKCIKPPVCLHGGTLDSATQTCKGALTCQDSTVGSISGNLCVVSNYSCGNQPMYFLQKDENGKSTCVGKNLKGINDRDDMIEKNSTLLATPSEDRAHCCQNEGSHESCEIAMAKNTSRFPGWIQSGSTYAKLGCLEASSEEGLQQDLFSSSDAIKTATFLKRQNIPSLNMGQCPKNHVMVGWNGNRAQNDPYGYVYCKPLKDPFYVHEFEDSNGEKEIEECYYLFLSNDSGHITLNSALTNPGVFVPTGLCMGWFCFKPLFQGEKNLQGEWIGKNEIYHQDNLTLYPLKSQFAFRYETNFAKRARENSFILDSKRITEGVFSSSKRMFGPFDDSSDPDFSRYHGISEWCRLRLCKSKNCSSKKFSVAN